MTITEFGEALGDLIAKAKNLSLEDVLSELEMACDTLRDEIADAEPETN